MLNLKITKRKKMATLNEMSLTAMTVRFLLNYFTMLTMIKLADYISPEINGVYLCIGAYTFYRCYHSRTYYPLFGDRWAKHEMSLYTVTMLVTTAVALASKYLL
jgi:hypothetical protein